MAKYTLTVRKEYKVEIVTPRDEMDVSDLQEEAQRLVMMGDSNVVYKGIVASQIEDVKLTKEEEAEMEAEFGDEQDCWNKLHDITEEKVDKVETEEKKKMSLYTELKESGAEMDNHSSDLYVKFTQEVVEILAHHNRENTSLFISNIDGKMWVDIPFAYEPWWDGKRD